MSHYSSHMPVFTPLYLSNGMEWQEIATCHPSLFYVKGEGKDKKNGLFKQWDLHSLLLC